MKAKVLKSFNLLLQIVILVVAYGFIYTEVIRKMNIAGLLAGFQGNFSETTFIVLLTGSFLLMFLNLGIEAQKWRFLIGKFEHVPFYTSVKAVFAGVTVSVFTPNRVGEYFGRVFMLRQLNPLKGVLITFIGSMGQLMATILAGSLGVLFFLPRIIDAVVFTGLPVYWGIVIATMIMLGLLMLLYLNFPVISVFLQRLFPGSREKIAEYTGVFESYSSAELTHVLLLSLLRYAVFTLQFILLLLAFGIKMQLSHYIVVIPVIFLVMTVIPTIALSELGIRGSVSMYLIGFYIHDAAGVFDLSSLAVVAASTILWLINLAVPAIVGTLFVTNLRFFRPKNN
jgi:hypothetical protein